MNTGLLLRDLVASACIAAALAGDVGAARASTKETAMSSDDEDHVTTSSSRVVFGSPDPISFEGKRYEEIANGEQVGLEQRTGLMSVTDEASHQRLKVVRIYDYPREPGVEDDVGDVFFFSMELDAATREIVVESERHDRFAYRIDDATVRKLP